MGVFAIDGDAGAGGFEIRRDAGEDFTQCLGGFAFDDVFVEAEPVLRLGERE